MDPASITSAALSSPCAAQRPTTCRVPALEATQTQSNPTTARTAIRGGGAAARGIAGAGHRRGDGVPVAGGPQAVRRRGLRSAVDGTRGPTPAEGSARARKAAQQAPARRSGRPDNPLGFRTTTQAYERSRQSAPADVPRPRGPGTPEAHRRRAPLDTGLQRHPGTASRTRGHLPTADAQPEPHTTLEGPAAEVRRLESGAPVCREGVDVLAERTPKGGHPHGVTALRFKLLAYWLYGP